MSSWVFEPHPKHRNACIGPPSRAVSRRYEEKARNLSVSGAPMSAVLPPAPSGGSQVHPTTDQASSKSGKYRCHCPLCQSSLTSGRFQPRLISSTSTGRNARHRNVSFEVTPSLPIFRDVASRPDVSQGAMLQSPCIGMPKVVVQPVTSARARSPAPEL